MMTITKIGGGNAAGYYAHENGFAGYLAKESQAHGEPDGQWYGKAASAFGIDASHPPTLEQMSRLLAGFDANSGEPLIKGAGQENRVQAFDITLSPPKSVSTLLAALPDSQKGNVLNAQEKAVHKALSFLEKVAGSCRTGHGGSERVEVGKMLMATFEHSTSRENDPQIHHHSVIMNLIASGGKVRTLDASLIYQWARTVGAIYHAELAANFKELGYGVEAKGDKEVFEIVGVPKKLLEYWSKRTKQVESVLEEMGADSSDHTAKKHASLSSRKKKGAINRAELFERWQDEAIAFEFEPEKIKGLKSIEQEYSPDGILKELTESKSVLTIKDIYQVVALRSVGSVDADSIYQNVLNRLKSR
jgi:conjugative relaxase-like TrwC/TraI family protein